MAGLKFDTLQNTILFDDETLRVEARDVTRDRCFITFTPWTSRPPAPAFGSALVQKHDLAGVYFISKFNDWWQSSSIENAISVVNEQLQSKDRVAYGSSMGAFAAVAFAGKLRCATSVAISPQATLDRAIVPWETRWQDEATRFAMPLGNAGDHVVAGLKLHIVYDDRFKADAQHARLIAGSAASRGAQVLHHTFGFSGHPSGPALVETKAMGLLIDEILSGAKSGAAAERYRKSRWHSRSCAQAFLTNWLLLKNHPKMMSDVGKNFRDNSFWDARMKFLLGRALLASGQPHDALLELEQAISRDSKTTLEISNLRNRILELLHNKN